MATLPEELAASLRKWLAEALAQRFQIEAEADASGTVSTWGHEWEVVSIDGILPGDPATHDVGGALIRLIDNLCLQIHVERPGGKLILRGPTPADGLAAGLRAEVRAIGTHAYRVRLVVAHHPVTLEEARARARSLQRIVA